MAYLCKELKLAMRGARSTHRRIQTTQQQNRCVAEGSNQYIQIWISVDKMHRGATTVVLTVHCVQIRWSIASFHDIIVAFHSLFVEIFNITNISTSALRRVAYSIWTAHSQKISSIQNSQSCEVQYVHLAPTEVSIVVSARGESP